MENIADLESLWKCSQEFHPDEKANQRRHTAVRNSRCEVENDGVLLVINNNILGLYHVQLFKCQRMLRINDMPHHVEYFLAVELVNGCLLVFVFNIKTQLSHILSFHRVHKGSRVNQVKAVHCTFHAFREEKHQEIKMVTKRQTS